MTLTSPEECPSFHLEAVRDPVALHAQGLVRQAEVRLDDLAAAAIIARVAAALALAPVVARVATWAKVTEVTTLVMLADMGHNPAWDKKTGGTCGSS